MEYNDILKYIFSLGNFGLEPTLNRITLVLEKLGNPQKSLKAIHIAGTNGKGSVSAMLASVFAVAGYKTGLFISPYIIEFRERIQINGEYISQKDLCIYAERVISTGVELTQFEFITALAFLYFKDKNIDILICETGLGGRLDATNILENKLLTVITKIGLDHTAILGNTIEKITEEKCGILRKNVPTVTTPYQNPKALKVILQKTTNLIVPLLSELNILKNEQQNTYIYKGKEYSLSLLGEYQIENSLIVLEALNASGYNIPYETVCAGLKNAFIPARLEIMSHNPLIVLDGAHNPDGAEVLAKQLKKHGGKVTAVVGMLKDKDYKEFLSKTLKFCANCVAVEIDYEGRKLSAEELCAEIEKNCPCVIAKNYDDAIEKAIKIAGQNPIFIFGSLYLASGIRKTLLEKLK